MTEPEFVPWPKIARLANERMFITEKLDGTNACIQFHPDPENEDSAIMLCQSRNRMITPGKDNAGFATWATENQVTLFQDLGFGLHFGEWWGLGIQRNYGLTEKRFSLFNMYRWSGRRGSFLTPQLDAVPLLYAGVFDTGVIETVHAGLLTEGSNAVPGWPSPEGIVVYLTEARTSYKLTDAVVGSKPRLDTE